MVTNFLGSQLPASEILNNLSTFLACELSIDPQNAAAKSWTERIRKMWARYKIAFDPFDELFIKIPESWVESFLADVQILPWVFYIQEARRHSDQRLSPESEKLLISLEIVGLHSWTNLHTQVASSLRIDIGEDETKKNIGLGASQGYLQDSNPQIREAAWRALQEAWKAESDTCASILNNLAGWRLETCKQRSTVSFPQSIVISDLTRD